MKIRSFVAVILLTTFNLVFADKDLTYPPPGVTAPIVDPTKGQENHTTPLTRDEAEYRRNISNRQHTIIAPGFSADTIRKDRNKAPKVASPPKPNVFDERTVNTKADTMSAISAVPNSSARGLLWKIERALLKPSYLFGTIHVDDPRVVTLPHSVQSAFDLSNIFTPEINMEMSDLASVSLELFTPGGGSLESVIGTTLFNEVVRILEPKGIPPLLAKSMKPWAVALVLSMPTVRNGEVLDQKLYLEAKQQGKSIQPLETLQEQIGIFNNMSEDHQITLLKGAVANYEKLPEMIEQLIQTYLSRDIDKLQSLSKSLGPDDPEMIELLNDILVVKRNINMSERLSAILDHGNAFIAVGALHLPGPEGIIRLLENKGYKLTAV